jgi:hypothetical protein
MICNDLTLEHVRCPGLFRNPPAIANRRYAEQFLFEDGAL